MLAWLTAATFSAAVILSSPVAVLAPIWIRDRFPGHVVWIVGGLVGLSVAAAVVSAARRIEGRHRARRYFAIGAALMTAVAYGLAVAGGDIETDVVERVHFIEYGLVAALFYRAAKPSGDLGVLALPVLAGILVGTLDEWLQWFVPVRVGEARDVALNLVAVSCGAVFMLGADPPARWQPVMGTRSRRTVGLAGALAVLAFTGFAQSVNVGTLVSREGLTFLSHHTRAQLETAQDDRAARWAQDPPRTLRRISREDQYLDEAYWHVRARNRAWDAGDAVTAFHENRILELFFAPVLDTPTYVTPEGTRWPAAQREEAAVRAAAAPGPFTSHAEPYRIYLWPRTAIWAVALAAAILLVGWATL